MSFSDFPVFRISPRGEPVKMHRDSRKLPLHFRAVTHRLTATNSSAKTARTAPEEAPTRQPSWAFLSLQRLKLKSPFTTGLPSPARTHS